MSPSNGVARTDAGRLGSRPLSRFSGTRCIDGTAYGECDRGCQLEPIEESQAISISGSLTVRQVGRPSTGDYAPQTAITISRESTWRWRESNRPKDADVKTISSLFELGVVTRSGWRRRRSHGDVTTRVTYPTSIADFDVECCAASSSSGSNSRSLGTPPSPTGEPEPKRPPCPRTAAM